MCRAPVGRAFGNRRRTSHRSWQDTPYESVSVGSVADRAPRYLNHPLVASVIAAGVHTGASRQYSMLSSMALTPSVKDIFALQLRSRSIFPTSAKVQSGSPGRLG